MNVMNPIARQALAGCSDYLCWTRMQAEAGQTLEAIIARKERERRAGGGLFFWGVGNAPSTMIRPLSRMGVRVPVVFSIMKGKPRKADHAPEGLLAWTAFIDHEGIERPVPAHVLVTSRRDTANRVKTAHYALICRSDEPLALRSGQAFHHRLFRNAGPGGAAVGASQVTALVEPATAQFDGPAEYEQNLVAELTGSYWVRLTQPVPIDAPLAGPSHNRRPQLSPVRDIPSVPSLL